MTSNQSEAVRAGWANMTPEARALRIERTSRKATAASVLVTRSDETRLRMSEAAKFRGPRVWTDEQKAKLSAALKGKHPSPETRAKLCAARRHRLPPSPETRAKISAAAKRQGPPSVETREKISAANTNPSPESRSKMSAAQKKLWENPAHREKCLVYAKDHPTDIERKLMGMLEAADVEYVFQYPVPGTRYVADFYLPQTNTVVEADGERWHTMRELRDARRADEIRALGFKVAQLWGKRINKAKVLESLELAVR